MLLDIKLISKSLLNIIDYHIKFIYIVIQIILTLR